MTRDVVGRNVWYVKYNKETRAPDTFGARPRIGLLYIDGDIVDGRAQTVPLLGMKLVGSYTITHSIKALEDDVDIKAVVLRIESPRGGLRWRRR